MNSPWAINSVARLSIQSDAPPNFCRSTANDHWPANRQAIANNPTPNEGDGDETVEANSEPTATVIAKSAADIFEKLRSPTTRVYSRIAA